MAPTSHLSRYQPAVLAVTGVAAGVGIYLLYSTYRSSQGESALRRSNAVHHTQPRVSTGFLRPTAERPLGAVVFRRGRRSFEWDLAIGRFPDQDAIADAIGEIGLARYTEAKRQAIQGILISCSRARTPQQVQSLADTPFARLPYLINSGDPGLIRDAQDILVASLSNVELALIREEIDSFDMTRMGITEPGILSDDSAFDIAETDIDEMDRTPREPSQGIKGLLYYIAEDEAKKKAYEHRGIGCEGCHESPIRGIRWHCLNCLDFDLCSTCEMTTEHQKTHVMAKIKIPLPVLSQPSEQYPLWYPGDYSALHPPLDPAAKKRLAQQYELEEPKIEALFDQFTCLANVPIENAQIRVRGGIDHRAFVKALTPARWRNRFAPNAIMDRMFAFYDTNNDGVIGFEEFVSGIAYLRGPKRYATLNRALKGFDMDGNNYVDRTDFIRLFRAKYKLQQQLVSDMIEGQEHHQTLAAMDVLRSRQPISSIFHEEDIPRGQQRALGGKQADVFGDMQPLPGIKSILEQNDPWPASEEPRLHRPTQSQRDAESRERLRNQVSRFEEMLYSRGDHNTETQQTQPPWQANIGVNGTLHLSQPANNATQQDPAISDGSNSQLDPDVLLRVIEQGFNDMLDPLFKSKEIYEQAAIDSRKEREQWREEIDKVIMDRRALTEKLRAGSQQDPLMATAFDSHNTPVLRRYKMTGAQESNVKADLVQTDDASLSKMETDIAQQSLDKLLASAGYQRVDQSEPESEHSFSSPVRHSFSSLYTGAVTDTDGADATVTGRNVDPTMPQHRPDAETRQLSPLSNQKHAVERIPERSRLEELARLDDIAKDIEERGGPGRLHLDEIEEMAKDNSKKELKGLVTSWLEYASF